LYVPFGVQAAKPGLGFYRDAQTHPEGILKVNCILRLIWCCTSVTFDLDWNGRKGGNTMPAKNPRINIVIEPAMYETMHDIAAAQNISLSSLAKDLIKEALVTHEDVVLAALAEERERTFDSKESLSHDQVWD
jgi:hypothetical protein